MHYFIETTGYCYHLFNVVSFHSSQSDHIKRFFIFNMLIRFVNCNWPRMSWRDSRSTTLWSCCSSSRRCRRRRSIRTRFRRSKGESTSRLRESPAGASDRSRVRAGGEACPQGPSWLGREWRTHLAKKWNRFAKSVIIKYKSAFDNARQELKKNNRCSKSKIKILF